MKLRTSFFNPTVLRKDITRFAPVWALYTLFAFLAFFLLWESNENAARFANEASYVFTSMGVVNFVYATICALTLFGDLFNTRLCNALHAFPLRREGWFLTHCAAGFLFCLVPNTAAALLAALLLQEYFCFALLWLGIMLLQFLFFFGAGVFSVMCAGNRLGAVAVCGIFNFLAVLVFWLYNTFYAPLLYGVDFQIDPYLWFSPVVGFSNFQYVETSYDKMTDATTLIEFMPQEWIYLFVAAGVGAVLLGLALLIYRKRNLENAGNLISLKGLSPVFLIVYTLCTGAVLYYISDIFSSGGRYVFILIGFAIGFFTGKMLLEKKVNVFRGKAFLVFFLLLSVFGITVGVTKLDPAGITRYVPKAENVKQIQLSPNASTYYWENPDFVLTESEDIQNITQMHQYLIDNRNEEKDMPIRISYTLQSGRVVERLYYISVESTAGQVLKGYFSSAEYVLGTEDMTALLENAFMLDFDSEAEGVSNLFITTGTVDEQYLYYDKYSSEKTLYYLTEDLSDGTTPIGLNVPLTRELMEAIVKDCQSGAMAQQWEYHNDQECFGWLTIGSFAEVTEDISLYTGKTYEVTYSNSEYLPLDYLQFRIFEDCTNTIAYLKSISQP